MSASFIRIVDFSLLPFSLVILGKLVGVYLVISSLGLDWGVADFTNSVITASPIVFGENVAVVASYSNLLMFALIAIGLGIQVAKIRLSDLSGDAYNRLRRLLASRLLTPFEGARLIYTRISVWLVYCWTLVFFIGLDAVLGRTYGWIALLSIVTAVFFTAIILWDIQLEIRKSLGSAEFKRFSRVQPL